MSEAFPYLVVGLTAFLASGVTLYSGFGLGTALLPVFALFFPVSTAVAGTAVVHLLNNVFKGMLLVRRAEWRIVRAFGLPAIPAALLGAWLLTRLSSSSLVFEWSVAGRVVGPTAAGLTIGIMLVALAIVELQPWFQRLAAPRRLLPYGGLLTGFVGGLTGQQGAFRSIFLLKSGLDPAAFVATGVMIALLVDLSRIPVYAVGLSGSAGAFGKHVSLLAVATGCAFAGAALGVRLLRRTTIGVVRYVFAAALILIGLTMAIGLIG